jgi:hypothetical protein
MFADVSTMFGAQTVSKGGEKKLIETWGGIRI